LIRNKTILQRWEWGRVNGREKKGEQQRSGQKKDTNKRTSKRGTGRNVQNFKGGVLRKKKKGGGKVQTGSYKNKNITRGTAGKKKKQPGKKRKTR